MRTWSRHATGLRNLDVSKMNIIDSSDKQQTQQERFEKVRTLVFADSANACIDLAADVAELIRQKAEVGEPAVLGLATGSTPVPFYRELIRLHREEGLSFQNVVTFNLDEYYGLDADHRESYARFMNEQLFSHIDIPKENINIPDGTVALDDVYDSCVAYEAKIQSVGGIDLQILGIGQTGHIGFNEPGSSVDSRTRMITLDRVTLRDAAADFLGEANVPRYAITMGVGTIMAAHKIVLMAWGANKAEILREAVEGEVTDQISASFLQDHDGATFLVDTQAASHLTRLQHPWLVGSVKWDASMTRRAVVWLSQKLNKAVLKLVDQEYNETGAGELITASGPAYNLNIRVFNQLQHTITGWPGGKPDADDTNRPERSSPHPKRVLVFSPEPSDAVASMGGTIERLIKQGHEVRLICQTSGNLRVSDVAAQKFASVIQEMKALGREGWGDQVAYGAMILEQIEKKGGFGEDPEELRQLKGLILRGEARDAAEVCGLGSDAIRFLDLPFYENGRYRQFAIGDADVELCLQELNAFEPHQIYASGHIADPSSVQANCFAVLTRALEKVAAADAGWRKQCCAWWYRGKETPLGVDEIEMAVPMSPDQVLLKTKAIRIFQSISIDETLATGSNAEVAVAYDALGLAEYEAIEAFERG